MLFRSLTLLGQESARSHISAAADNYGRPTLGPLVHLFLPPLCLSSSAHKPRDLISPHPNLPSASRPSLCHLLQAAPQEPSSARQHAQTSHSTEPCGHSGYSGAPGTTSRVLGCLTDNSASILRLPPLCWARSLGRCQGNWAHRTLKPNTHCIWGSPCKGRRQVGQPGVAHSVSAAGTQPSLTCMEVQQG